jgi:hypothetical protein
MNIVVYLAVYCASLRGEEIPKLEIGGTAEHQHVSVNHRRHLHITLALKGRVKGKTADWNARWRKVEGGHGKQLGVGMMEHYSDVVAMVEMLLQYWSAIWSGCLMKDCLFPVGDNSVMLHQRGNVSMTTAEARSDDHQRGLHQLPPSGRSWLLFFFFTSLESHVSDTTNAVMKASLILRPDNRTLHWPMAARQSSDSSATFLFDSGGDSCKLEPSLMGMMTAKEESLFAIEGRFGLLE